MARTTDITRAQHAVNVASVSIAAFLMLMAFLLWRLDSGKDPALGAGAQPVAQKVIKRKVVVHRKVVKLVRDLPPLPPKRVAAPSAAGSGYGTSSSSGTSSGSTYSPPAQSYSAPAPAPVQSAPAPAPAPAPSTSAS